MSKMLSPNERISKNFIFDNIPLTTIYCQSNKLILSADTYSL